MNQNEERAEVFFDTLRMELPAYITEIEREAVRDEVPVIRRAVRDLLRYLLRVNRPKKVLEVGTAVGYSALFMKECLPAASRITTIEKVEMRLVKARENFEMYDREKRIRLVEGDACEKLVEMVDREDSFDFIFMDAAKGQYLNFLPSILSILRPGGILVSDNILHDCDVLESRYAVKRRDRTIHARMREYLYTITHMEELETICLSLGDGVTVSTRMNSTIH
ncbi:MAG: O-methyltransferase [Eubacterium sp.]|jgi:predicted O-methyltransferase YrrM|nr:O-methyltransferase [Eubacterium sp.]